MFVINIGDDLNLKYFKQFVNSVQNGKSYFAKYHSLFEQILRFWKAKSGKFQPANLGIPDSADYDLHESNTEINLFFLHH